MAHSKLTFESSQYSFVLTETGLRITKMTKIYNCIPLFFSVDGVLCQIIFVNTKVKLSQIFRNSNTDDLKKILTHTHTHTRRTHTRGKWCCNIAKLLLILLHAENFMAIYTTLSVVIWFSMGTLEIFATLVYVFTMRVVIYDILSMAIIPTLSTSTLFCNLCYILLWISPCSVVKIAIRT